MRILFHNYSNEVTTEPLYLFQAFKQSGLDAHIWADRRVSAFDVFDTVQPNVFVSHYRNITPDVMKYLDQAPQISLVLNVTGISEAQMKDVEAYLTAKNITVPFVFTNEFSYKPRPYTKFKCERLYPAFDLFRIRQHTAAPLCKEAVLSIEYDDFLKEELSKRDVYHLVQVTEGDKDENFDLRVNASSIQELSQYYHNFALVGNTDFVSSQLFFDLNFNAHNISVRVSDDENFSKFLTDIFVDEEALDDMERQVKNQLKSRHTPFHRAATLCKYLKFKDGMSQVERVKGQLGQMLENL
jgi:hypothetical protein